MGDIVTLTDQTWEEHLQNKAALVMVSTGKGWRSGFSTAFKEAALKQDDIVIAELDPRKNPHFANQLGVSGDSPTLIGWYDDVDVVRRTNPWGADVSFVLDLLEKIMSENLQPAPSDTIIGKPFTVTDATFQQEVIEYSKTTPVLVDFWAAWCGPCRMVAPIMERLAADFGDQVRIAKVDTDANPALSQAFRIMSIPTIMAFKQGQLVFNEAGAYPEPAFRDLVQQLIALQIPSEAVAEAPAETKTNATAETSQANAKTSAPKAKKSTSKKAKTVANMQSKAEPETQATAALASETAPVDEVKTAAPKAKKSTSKKAKVDAETEAVAVASIEEPKKAKSSKKTKAAAEGDAAPKATKSRSKKQAVQE